MPFCFKTADLIVNSARSFTVAKKIFSILPQPFVVQENPGNDKDSEDLHVLHEGQGVFFGKLSSSPILLTGIQMSRNHVLYSYD